MKIINNMEILMNTLLRLLVVSLGLVTFSICPMDGGGSKEKCIVYNIGKNNNCRDLEAILSQSPYQSNGMISFSYRCDSDKGNHDLGQAKSQAFIEQVSMNTWEDRVAAVIVYAHGIDTTATLGYYASNRPHPAKVSALICESVVADANEEMFYNATQSKGSFITKLPYAYNWFPYLMVFLQDLPYDPSGSQPIDNVENLDHNVPIILIHSADDKDAPYWVTQALYFRLAHYQNVYLISDNDMDKRKKIIGAILAHHQNQGMLHLAAKIDGVDLEDYRPSTQKDGEENAFLLASSKLFSRQTEFKRLAALKYLAPHKVAVALTGAVAVASIACLAVASYVGIKKVKPYVLQLKERFCGNNGTHAADQSEEYGSDQSALDVQDNLPDNNDTGQIVDAD